jgi:hypothetical protein
MTSIAHHPNMQMNTTPPTHGTTDSKARVWTGRILTGISVLFLLFDSVTKLMLVKPVVDAMPALGYPVSLARPIGVILLACLTVYLIPSTRVLGAVLITGFLGGAVATNVRIGAPIFTHDLLPIYVAVILWAGLYLRDARVRALIPFRGSDA